MSKPTERHKRTVERRLNGSPFHWRVSVHRSYIIRQHEHEHAVASCCRAGEDSSSQDLDRSVIGKCQVVISGAEGRAKAFQLLVSAYELHAFDSGGGTGSPAEQHEEFCIACFLGDFSKINGANLLQFVLVFGHGGI